LSHREDGKEGIRDSRIRLPNNRPRAPSIKCGRFHESPTPPVVKPQNTSTNRAEGTWSAVPEKVGSRSAKVRQVVINVRSQCTSSRSLTDGKRDGSQYAAQDTFQRQWTSQRCHEIRSLGEWSKHPDIWDRRRLNGKIKPCGERGDLTTESARQPSPVPQWMSRKFSVILNSNQRCTASVVVVLHLQSTSCYELYQRMISYRTQTVRMAPATRTTIEHQGTVMTDGMDFLREVAESADEGRSKYGPGVIRISSVLPLRRGC